jgi:formate dehydrogenase (NADP+) alpha subunit
VAGLATTYGSGAMTNSIGEIGDASCILAIGTNTTQAHPVIGLEVKKAVRKGAKLIVANPKRIDLCRFADLWLQHRAGTDVALLMGIMRVIVDEGLADEAFIAERTADFEAFRESLQEFNLERVESITGVPAEKIREAARIYATTKPGSILYSMGITQHSHGTDNVLAIGALAMATGNIGKPSAGVNPLRGQNNVQGACDMGCLPNVYTGYQQVANPGVQGKFQDAWGMELTARPGLTLTEMFQEVMHGKVKAIYLVGENPVLTDADTNQVRKALGEIEFLVVQDIFMTETAQLADVVLPAAAFAEKDGTFTNTERRVQRVRKALDPPGQAMSDLWIISEVAKRMGASGFEFEGPEQVMEEIASVTPSYGGVTYPRIDGAGLHWPVPNADHAGTPILHTKQFVTADGKGRFLPLHYRESAELPDAQYPLVLTTDRSLYHYHSGSMTRRVEGLNELRREELAIVNPRDAEALGIADGEMVRVVSRRGEVFTRAKVSGDCPPGLISMTFHFAESPTNVLTNPALDPKAKTPELKVSAVRLEKLPTPA